MGNKLFGADIAGQLAKALGPLLLPCKLIKVTPGTRTTGALTAGTNPTKKTFSCRGMVESFATNLVDDTRILAGDRKIMILGDTLAKGIVPEPSDEVEIEGRIWIVINLIERDPDAATYVLHAR